MEDIIDFAANFAKKAHGDQKRKYTNKPYYSHLVSVAALLVAHDQPDHVVAAGYLHDVLEDTSVTYAELAAEFGEVIADLVQQVTDVSKPADGNRAARKALDLEHLRNSSEEGAAIKLADLIDNASDIVGNDPAFAKVYLAEKENLLAVLMHGPTPLFKMALAVLARSKERLMEDEDEKFPRKPDGTIDTTEIEAPTHLDGTPVDKEEAAKMHARLAAGEMSILFAPGVEEDMAEAGLSVEDMRQLMMAAAKKTMS